MESEGRAEVRGSGRVTQEVGGPRQTPLEQDANKERKENLEKLQEGHSSSLITTRREPEDDQHSIDPKERKKDGNCKKDPVSRRLRKGGRVAGRIRGRSSRKAQ